MKKPKNPTPLEELRHNDKVPSVLRRMESDVHTIVQSVARASDYMEQLTTALTDIINDFETTGCEGQGTVQISTINKARKLLRMRELDE